MSTSKLEDRREARRRKILENSENRLKLITGRSEIKNETGTKEVSSREHRFPNISDMANGQINYDSFFRNISDGSIPIPTSEFLRDISGGSIASSEEFLRNISDGSIPTSEFLRNICDDTIPTSEEESSQINYPNAKDFQQNSLFIFIPLAILFRFALEMGVTHVFNNSMVIVFILVKCGTFGFYGVPIPQSSTFIGNLLLFSGISSSKIKLLTFMFHAILSILKDFALYTFIFISADIFFHTVKIIS